MQPCATVGNSHDLFAFALVDLVRQSLARERIDDRQGPQPAAVEQRVGDEVHRPAFVRLERSRLTLTVCRADVPARSLEPQAQPLVPVETVDPLVIHPPTLPAQQDVDSEVAVAHPALGQITDAHPQRCLIGLGRAVADARPADAERGAAAPLAHPVRLLNLVHELASPSRRQSFFASTSCRMCLSRLRSATSCLSLRFSSSSCFSRRNSPVPRPP